LPNLYPIEPVIFSKLVVDERKNINSLSLSSSKMIRDLKVIAYDQIYLVNKSYKEEIVIPNSVDRPFSWRIVKKKDKNYNIYTLYITSSTFIENIELYLMVR
jgi:hypothetical protein